MPQLIVGSGNSSPKLIRSSVYAFPETSSLSEACKVPLGIVVSPFGAQENEEAVPKCDYDPIRCSSCRGFLNPWCTLSHDSTWHCNLCGHSNGYSIFDVKLVLLIIKFQCRSQLSRNAQRCKSAQSIIHFLQITGRGTLRVNLHFPYLHSRQLIFICLTCPLHPSPLGSCDRHAQPFVTRCFLRQQASSRS